MDPVPAPGPCDSPLDFGPSAGAVVDVDGDNEIVVISIDTRLLCWLLKNWA